MKTLNTLRILALPVAALCLLSAAPAHAADNGSFSSRTQTSGDAAGNLDSKTTEKATDEAGTTQTSTSKEDVDVGANGDTEVNKSAKTTTDPAGLGNESSAKTSEDISVKANGNSDSKTTADSVSANGTEDQSVAKKTVRVDSKGRRKVKAVHKKSHDPRGLMNKTTTKTTDTSVQKDNGQTETTHQTTVNGKTTEKTDQVQ
jgi:hypothetical protein